MRLWHFTCLDGWAGIKRDGLLRPNQHPYLARPLVWLTDDPGRDRGALGLTSKTLNCDRMAVRIGVEVDDEAVSSWPDYADAEGVMPYIRKLFEAPPAEPKQWWVSRKRVVVGNEVLHTLGHLIAKSLTR